MVRPVLSIHTGKRILHNVLSDRAIPGQEPSQPHDRPVLAAIQIVEPSVTGLLIILRGTRLVVQSLCGLGLVGVGPL
jgi:hypothetical protein